MDVLQEQFFKVCYKMYLGLMNQNGYSGKEITLEEYAAQLKAAIEETVRRFNNKLVASNLKLKDKKKEK